jgi:small-conductance mechanosensitive channel
LLIGGCVPVPAAETAEGAAAEEVAFTMGSAKQLEELNDSLAPLVGEWVRTEIITGVSWGQVVLSLLLVTLIFIAERVLSWLLRRSCQKPSAPLPDEKGTNRSALLRSLIEAAIPPLSIFIWVWGGSAVLWLLLVRLEASGNGYLLLMMVYSVRKAANFLILFWFIYRLIKTAEVLLLAWAGSNDRKWDDVLAAVIIRALRLVVPLLAVTLMVPMLDIPPSFHQFFKQGIAILLIAAIGFILFQLADTGEKAVLDQYRVDTKDNLAMRKVQTQVRVLKRVIVIMILVFTMASMLMVFDSVRQLGTSLLASAGVVGIVVGFAAQRSIASLFAGVQIAFTQPIRLDDGVLVEGEYGRVEEITLTYVVVNLWDSRRLIVPIGYFIEKPFQNWTRTRAELLGAVMLNVDYSTPIAPLREELDRILEKSPHWDRRVKGLQVTDVKDHAVQIRILASAGNSGQAFDLRCEIREQMIHFLQKNYPECLPKIRLAMEGKTDEHAAFAPEPVKLKEVRSEE